MAGRRTDLDYDERGFLIGAVQRDGDDELARVAYTYDEHGRLSEIARGNGVTTAIEYTSVHGVASETTESGGEVQSERSYHYDPASGNLDSRIDRAREHGELVAQRTDYRYDALGRLTGSTVRAGADADAPVASQTAYELSVSGQVTAETVTTEPGTEQSATTQRRFVYSPVGELETITTTHPDGRVEVGTQVWDAVGNLVRGADGVTYEWDAANRRIAEARPDGTRIETAYWADGTRAQLSTATGATVFYWDGTTLLNDAHAAGEGAEGVASYLIGVNRHSRSAGLTGESAATEYYGTDRHGNVTDLTDAGGQTTTRYAYTDYGVPTVNAPSDAPAALPAGVGEIGRNPFQYASEYTHGDGTQFLRERVLDPELFGFQSKDRESLHNLFGYADANPIMLVDPSGRDAILDWFAVGTAAYGAVAALGGVLAIAIGGVALGPFGFAAAAFGVLDGAFAALEGWSVATGTTFMPDDVALGVGIGLAVTGSLFLVGGIVKAARPRAWNRWFGGETEVTRPVKRESVADGDILTPDDVPPLNTGPVQPPSQVSGAPLTQSQVSVVPQSAAQVPGVPARELTMLDRVGLVRGNLTPVRKNLDKHVVIENKNRERLKLADHHLRRAFDTIGEGARPGIDSNALVVDSLNAARTYVLKARGAGVPQDGGVPNLLFTPSDRTVLGTAVDDIDWMIRALGGKPKVVLKSAAKY